MRVNVWSWSNELTTSDLKEKHVSHEDFLRLPANLRGTECPCSIDAGSPRHLCTDQRGERCHGNCIVLTGKLQELRCLDCSGAEDDPFVDVDNEKLVLDDKFNGPCYHVTVNVTFGVKDDPGCLSRYQGRCYSRRHKGSLTLA